MAIQAIGNFGHVMHFGGIPVQNLGMLAITTLALNAISSIPVAVAKEIPMKKEICETLCSPLPGDKDDAPEKVCQEVCKQDNVITKVTEWTVDKANQIMGTKVAKVLAPPIGAWGQCSSSCGGLKWLTETIHWAVPAIPGAEAAVGFIDSACVASCLTAKGAQTLYRWVW